MRPEVLGSYDVGEPITAIAWSPKGDEIAVGSYKTIRIFRIGEAEPRLTIQSRQRVWRLGWNHDATMLASAWQSNSLELLATDDGRQLGFAPSVVPIVDFAWSPTRDRIVISDTAGRLTLWSVDRANATPIQHSGVTGSLKTISWNSDGALVAIGEESGATSVWNSETNAYHLLRPLGRGAITVIAWLDVNHVIAGMETGGIAVIAVAGKSLRAVRVIEVGEAIAAMGS